MKNPEHVLNKYRSWTCFFSRARNKCMCINPEHVDKYKSLDCVPPPPWRRFQVRAPIITVQFWTGVKGNWPCPRTWSVYVFVMPVYSVLLPFSQWLRVTKRLWTVFSTNLLLGNSRKSETDPQLLWEWQYKSWICGFPPIFRYVSLYILSSWKPASESSSWGNWSCPRICLCFLMPM